MSSILTLSAVDLHLKSEAGDVHVLKNISLDLPEGKTVAITGPSGSGKTTLLMTMAGLERPGTGRIAVAGTDITDFSEDALAKFRGANIGIVFQNFHLIPTMTALENVAVPLEFAGQAEAFARAAAALESVGLGAREKHYPGQLSGGEQQRVAVARAFAPRPRLILADEPTGNLDAETGAKVMEILFGLARGEIGSPQGGGTTLVLVTHDPALAAACDVQVNIRDGRIAA